MKIKYKIKLLSDWHVGSGLDSGAEADALALKDENNLPYIPGKTIKGLLKDSLLEINDVGKNSIKEDIDKIFGKENKDRSTQSGEAFFSNAEISEDEKLEIIGNNLSLFLYRNIASTAIKPNGTAKKNSLRTMEVCLPIDLYGSIEINFESDKDLLEKAFKWTRYLGVSRNRGLGRCKILSINE